MDLCPLTEEWIKMWYIYAIEYYSGIEKNEVMPFSATSMDLESVILSEVSQTKGEPVYGIPYMWHLKRNNTNELTKQKETHRFERMNLWFLRIGWGEWDT